MFLLLLLLFVLFVFLWLLSAVVWEKKVSGQYAVWLPDGRLMTVAYTVDGENGFQPKITFDTNNPLG